MADRDATRMQSLLAQIAQAVWRQVEVPLASYAALQEPRALDEGLFRRGGLACREYDDRSLAESRGSPARGPRVMVA